jgi:chromosome segregation ATPase
MSSNIKEILGLIEQFERAFDIFQQSHQNSSKEIVQNLSETWKKIKLEQTEIEKLENIINQHNIELTELRTKAEELEKKIEIPRTKKEELITKISELKTTLERTIGDTKKPKFELENLFSKLKAVNDKITTKEKEKMNLDQKKIENQNRESELKANFSQEKMNELEKRLSEIKQKNFFTSFLIEHSDEEIPEVAILASIMEKHTCKIDELKKILDVPPIMATRTIKQLAIKGILNFDENSGIITML